MGAKNVGLLQGTLDLILLRLLRAGRANDWQLTQSIQVVSMGALDVNSVYPALRRLEAQGLVKGRWAASENNRRGRRRPGLLSPAEYFELGEINQSFPWSERSCPAR